MEIAILGASGRVGKCLVNQILANVDDRIMGAYVSANSRSLGEHIDDTTLHYQTIDTSLERPSDLMIDFSTPAATMEILDDLNARTKALVIGTTGFTQSEERKIKGASRHSPIMIGANFANGFEAFVAVCRTLAATYPDEVPQLEETYHKRKKAVPSGTSLRLAREVADARRGGGCATKNDIPIKVNREGNVTGKHLCRIDLGQQEFSITFSVDGLDSYARGALLAGQWLLGRPNSLYTPADMLTTKLQDESLRLPDIQ